MSLTDKLEAKGIKIDELTTDEKETYLSMLNAVQQAQLTPEKLRDYIIRMRDSVEEELTKTDLTGKLDIFLKARLKNYMLLEAFLVSPEKAKKMFDNAVSGFTEKR